ncbi:hypothetical protein D3C73_1141510 [compost metagenome]
MLLVITIPLLNIILERLRLLVGSVFNVVGLSFSHGTKPEHLSNGSGSGHVRVSYTAHSVYLLPVLQSIASLEYVRHTRGELSKLCSHLTEAYWISIVIS